MINKIYIGSNNETKVLEIEKIESILNKYFEGYTIIMSKGYWKGQKEDSCIIEIIDSSIDKSIINELKTELKQDSILLIKQNATIAFI